MSSTASLTSIQRVIWSGSLPLSIRLSPSESRSYDQTDPYLVINPLLCPTMPHLRKRSDTEDQAAHVCNRCIWSRSTIHACHTYPSSSQDSEPSSHPPSSTQTTPSPRTAGSASRACRYDGITPWAYFTTCSRGRTQPRRIERSAELDGCPGS